MTHPQAVTILRGRVRALLTQVEMAESCKRPLEVRANSRIYRELRDALYLVECPQEMRDRVDRPSYEQPIEGE